MSHATKLILLRRTASEQSLLVPEAQLGCSDQQVMQIPDKQTSRRLLNMYW